MTQVNAGKCGYTLKYEQHRVIYILSENFSYEVQQHIRGQNEVCDYRV
jgi:hypothetical protein